MTAKTRRRVFVSVLLLALTLPAETILLKALQTPDDRVAARDWVASLDAQKFAVTADNVQAYPFAYRQAIMTRSSPDRRAAIWQRHIQGYIAQHPELDRDALGLLRSALAAMTPRALSQPTAEDRAAIHAVAEKTQALLGKEVAQYLFYELGPRTRMLASAEPLSMKLASLVRSGFVLIARNWDCECATGWGCGGSLICTSQEYCQWDVEWPMCGWAWADLCDGMCMSW